MSRVLVISVHPDDETLGCGGTLLRHRERGDELHWLVITAPHAPAWREEVINRKAAEVAAVADAYGFASVRRLGLPTTELDSLPLAPIIAQIREAADAIRPSVVYLVHHGDVHTDHHIAFTAAMSVFKTFYMRELGVQRILSFETLSSTEAAPPLHHRLFVPTVYHDVTPYLDQKVRIMEMFGTEAQSELRPRGASAIRALARYRGASIGVEYAEAFMLIREVD